MILCSKYHANQKSFQKHHYNSYSNDNKCLFSSRWFVFAKVVHLRYGVPSTLFFKIFNFLVYFSQILLDKNHKLKLVHNCSHTYIFIYIPPIPPLKVILSRQKIQTTVETDTFTKVHQIMPMFDFVCNWDLF